MRRLAINPILYICGRVVFRFGRGIVGPGPSGEHFALSPHPARGGQGLGFRFPGGTSLSMIPAGQQLQAVLRRNMHLTGRRGFCAFLFRGQSLNSKPAVSVVVSFLGAVK